MNAMRVYDDWARGRDMEAYAKEMQDLIENETTLDRLSRCPSFHNMSDAQKSFVKSLCRQPQPEAFHAMTMISRLKKYPRGITLDSFLAPYGKSSRRRVMRDVQALADAGIVRQVPMGNRPGHVGADGLILTEFA